MPMNMPPPGGLPSPMTQAPANAGAASSPQGNQGNIHAAMTKIKNAVQMLGEALPLIPMGTEEHSKVAKVIADLSKGLSSAMTNNPQLEMAAMQQAMKAKAQSAPMDAMARQFSAGQGAGQPPATSQPQPEAA